MVSFKQIFRKKELAIEIPTHKLVKETEEQLENELTTMGAEIVSTDILVKQEEDPNESKSDRFVRTHLKKYRKIVVLPGMDSLPLYIHLDMVDAIITHKEKPYISLIWASGGSSNISRTYYVLLNKLWILGRNLLMTVDLLDSKNEDEINTELAKIEGYESLAEKYISIHTEKETFVKKQNFKAATEKREEEKEVTDKIHELTKDIFYTFAEKSVLKDLSGEEIDE